MSANATTHDEDHGIAHVMPLKILFNVFAALMVLTVITVGITMIDFGSLNIVVALGIAVVKAALVVLYFMHLRYDNPFNAVIFVGCMIFVALFLTFSLTDTTAYHSSVEVKQADKIKKINVDKLLEEAAKESQSGAAPAHH